MGRGGIKQKKERIGKLGHKLRNRRITDRKKSNDIHKRKLRMKDLTKKKKRNNKNK